MESKKSVRSLFNDILKEVFITYKNDSVFGEKLIKYFVEHCDQWGDEELSKLIKKCYYEESVDPYYFCLSHNPLYSTVLKDDEPIYVGDKHKSLTNMYEFIITMKNNPRLVDIFC